MKEKEDEKDAKTYPDINLYRKKIKSKIGFGSFFLILFIYTKTQFDVQVAHIGIITDAHTAFMTGNRLIWRCDQKSNLYITRYYNNKTYYYQEIIFNYIHTS